MQSGLEIKESRLGKGLFVTASFPAGQTVLTFTGPTILGSGFDWSVKYANNSYLESRLIQIDADLFVEPTGQLQDYVNHVCQNPACYFRVRLTDAGPVGFLSAARDLSAGEEVTFDYSTGMVNCSWTMECACGFPECRKVVKNFNELPDEIAVKYLKTETIPSYVQDSWEEKVRKERKKWKEVAMVKKFVDDETSPWETRFRVLEKHHIEETVELFDKLSAARAQIVTLEKEVAALKETIENLKCRNERWLSGDYGDE